MAAAASTAAPSLMTKMMLSNSNPLPPHHQSNFYSTGLMVGDEPSASSNSSVECANFLSQAHQHHHYHDLNNNDEALKRLTRHVSSNGNEFADFEVSSQFSDIACVAGEDGVAADDMEQLCSELFTEEEAAAAAEVSSTEPSPGTVELMGPTGRKVSDGGEGSSMASSLPSQRSFDSQGHHNGVTVSMKYGSSAEVTAGSSPSSPHLNAYECKGASYLPNLGIPEVYHHCPPQGYGGNCNNVNPSVPSTIAVPQMTFDCMADPTAAAVAASSEFFQMNHNTNEPSLQFCHSLAKETQFSAGAAASVCPQPSKHTCAKCHYPGSDIKIKNCPNGCTYHARCLDLISLCNQKSNLNNTHHVHKNESMMAPTSLLRGVTPPTSMPLHNNGNMNGSGGESQCMLSYCPCCLSAGATGIEILPLDFDESDLVQRKVSEENEAKQRM
jgi:hypothetical protein